MESVSVTDQGAREKRPQPKGVVVKELFCLRIACQKTLKTPIQPEPVHDVSPDSATDTIGCFQEQGTNALVLQLSGAAKTR